MYQIKQFPEDFIVNEINELKFNESGKYAIFELKKTNYNTISAINLIADYLSIHSKMIGFSGTKDKIAVTTQLISVPSQNKNKLDNFSRPNIQLTFKGYSGERLYLGSHKENEFIITVRDIEKKTKSGHFKILNLFGTQRFSQCNDKIGLAIIKGDFKTAFNLIKESDSPSLREMEYHLSNQPNDYVGAIKKLPLKLLKLYVNSYQSKIWNELVTKINGSDIIPLPGFGVEYSEEIEDFVEELISKDNLSFRDFIIRQIPDLSAEGVDREVYIETDIEIIEEKDNLQVLKFRLKPGQYATTVIDYLYS